VSHMNSVKWPCSPWVLVAQWIERLPRISRRGLRYFFVPRSCHVE